MANSTVDYHTDYKSISNSMLSDFIESRRLFEGRYINDPATINRKSQTKQMEIGDIIHAVLLDGRPLRSCVAIYPDNNPLVAEAKSMTGPMRDKLDTDRKTAICKMLKMSVAEFDALKPGKEMKAAIEPRLPLNPIGASGVLTGDAEAFRVIKRLESVQHCVKRHEYEIIREVTNEVRRNEDYIKHIENPACKREYELRWINQFGQRNRCKVDFLLIGKEKCYAFDLKITAYHRPKAWKKFVAKTPRLQSQAAHYSDGISKCFDGKPVEWRWITVNPNPPVTSGSVMVHMLSPALLEKISAVYFDLMAAVQFCYESGDFSDIGEGEENVIDVDDFYKRSLEWEG